MFVQKVLYVAAVIALALAARWEDLLPVGLALAVLAYAWPLLAG